MLFAIIIDFEPGTEVKKVTRGKTISLTSKAQSKHPRSKKSTIGKVYAANKPTRELAH